MEQPDWTKIDIRVGEIVKVWNHPDAERLFCEEINVGEEEEIKEESEIEKMEDAF